MGVMQGIVPVLLPHMVNKMKETGDVKDTYLKCVEYICIISWPFFVFLSLMSTDIIEILYGLSWISASPLVSTLAVAAAVASIYSVNTHVFIATKNINLDVKNQSFSQVISVFIIISAAFYGLNELLMSIVISKIISFLFSTFYLCRATNIKYLDIITALVKPFFVGFLCFVFLLLSKNYLYLIFTDLYFSFFTSGFIFMIVWFLSVYIVRSDILKNVLNK
jgi:O-antigen/teichoic acid export membrane protein